MVGMTLVISCLPPMSLIAQTLIAQASQPQPVAPSVAAIGSFSDLASHAADQPAIARMVAQGIMKPVSPGTFEPDAPVPRGDFVVSIQHMLALKAPAQPLEFGDVPQTNEIYSALAATAPYMNRQLLCVGCALGTNFLADEPIDRGLIAITLVNVLIARNQVKLATVADADKSLANVADANLLIGPARRYLATALANGILNLQPGNKIDPMSAVSRDEFAVMLDHVQQQFKIPSVLPAADRH
jgi:hypothetical protein